MSHYNEREPMMPVTAKNPCPVCDKPDWCLVRKDRTAAFCQRVESPKRSGDAGWLHILTDTEPRPITPTRTASPSKPATCSKDWQAEAERYAANLDAEARKRQAVAFGLPDDALNVLPLLGLNPDAPCLTFPECDHTGKIVGINRRFRGGSKKAAHGAKRGLTLLTGWKELPGSVFVVEGPTDTLAMHAAGLCTVGRPSNSSAKFLPELFRDWPEDRAIVIVGENDRKPDGQWPGRSGAESVARTLARALNRTVFVAMPPDGSKDVRDFLTSTDHGGKSWQERGKELAEYLDRVRESFMPERDNLEDDRPADGPNDGPLNPHRLAEGFLRSVSKDGEPLRLRSWRGDFVEWSDGAYRAILDDELRGRMTAWIREEFIRHNQAAMQKAREAGGECPQSLPVTRKIVGDAANALHGICLMASSIEPPRWIDGATGPDTLGMLPLKNGILDLRTGQLSPPSPSFFTFTASPFEYNANAPKPVKWLKFLGQLWPNDCESVATLQEIFGYALTPDTKQQKIFFLLGPKRAGKGTITRILTELVGPGNCAGPTLGSLAANFGLSPLLGKSVAIVSDARLSGRADAAIIAERLLSISGEDAQTVDRKHKPMVTTKLTTRFVIASNELPRLSDASGALASRLIMLRFTASFFGSEDHDLTSRLIPELPGILLWAIEGWRRLQARGRFVQPASGAELLQEMEDLASPVGAFIRECCKVEPNASIETKEIYRQWCQWCEDHGRDRPGTEQSFGRDLRAVVPSVTTRRPKQNGERWREYEGIRLRRSDEPDAVGPFGSAGSATPSIATHTETLESNTQPTTGTKPKPIGAAIGGYADLADPVDPPRDRLFSDRRSGMLPD